jgi:hypothetical protein
MEGARGDAPQELQRPHLRCICRLMARLRLAAMSAMRLLSGDKWTLSGPHSSYEFAREKMEYFTIFRTVLGPINLKVLHLDPAYKANSGCSGRINRSNLE